MSVFNYSNKYTFNVGDKWSKGIMKYLSQNYKEKIQLLYNFVIEAAVDGKISFNKNNSNVTKQIIFVKGCEFRET